MSECDILDDGFGNEWVKCDPASKCGLEVVRPGSVQCWCDDVDRCSCGYPLDSFACKIRHVAVNVENLRRDRER